MNHIQEVFQEGNCKTLMCFICNSMHIYDHGLGKFGREYNAGRIDYRNKDEDLQILGKLLTGKESAREDFYDMNLCAKRFRSNYGAAIRDADMVGQNDSWEWRRTVHAATGQGTLLQSRRCRSPCSL